MNGTDSELYDDWFSDNRIELMNDFIENHLDEKMERKWGKYLADEFERWKVEK